MADQVSNNASLSIHCPICTKREAGRERGRKELGRQREGGRREREVEMEQK